MARTRRRRRRSYRRNPAARSTRPRYKSGPKKGQFKPTRKSTKRKSTKRKSAKRKSPARKRRRSSFKRPAGKVSRPRLYRTGRKGSYRYRRSSKSSIRAGTVINPFKIPSVKQIKSVFVDGFYGLTGYVGVNAVVFALDKYVLGGIKGSQGPAVAGLIDIAERIFGIGVTTWLGGKVFRGGNARRLIAVGGAVNVVMSTVKIANAQYSFLPESAQPLLSGYEYLDGDYLGDYIAMGDFVQSLPAGAGSTATGGFSALASESQAGVPLI